MHTHLSALFAGFAPAFGPNLVSPSLVPHSAGRANSSSPGDDLQDATHRSFDTLVPASGPGLSQRNPSNQDPDFGITNQKKLKSEHDAAMISFEVSAPSGSTTVFAFALVATHAPSPEDSQAPVTRFEGLAQHYKSRHVSQEHGRYKYARQRRIRDAIGSAKTNRLGAEVFKVWDTLKDVFNAGSGAPAFWDEESLRNFIEAVRQCLDALFRNSGFVHEDIDKRRSASSRRRISLKMH